MVCSERMEPDETSLEVVKGKRLIATIDRYHADIIARYLYSHE